MERYSALAEIVEPATLSGPVSPDPDDDWVLATALAARAELIVSRDKHLRNLKHFHRWHFYIQNNAIKTISYNLDFFNCRRSVSFIQKKGTRRCPFVSVS
jgi:predicted nucleic acid-binding protein